MLPSHPNKYLSDLLCETAFGLRVARRLYVPESFESKKLVFFHGQSCVRGPSRRRGRHAGEKHFRFSSGARGTRALLISFISRSTSYAVLSRMKTKAGAKKLLRGSGHDLIFFFPTPSLRSPFITTLPFSLTTPP